MLSFFFLCSVSNSACCYDRWPQDRPKRHVNVPSRLRGGDALHNWSQKLRRDDGSAGLSISFTGSGFLLLISIIPRRSQKRILSSGAEIFRPTLRLFPIRAPGENTGGTSRQARHCSFSSLIPRSVAGKSLVLSTSSPPSCNMCCSRRCTTCPAHTPESEPKAGRVHPRRREIPDL